MIGASHFIQSALIVGPGAADQRGGVLGGITAQPSGGGLGWALMGGPGAADQRGGVLGAVTATGIRVISTGNDRRQGRGCMDGRGLGAGRIIA